MLSVEEVVAIAIQQQAANDLRAPLGSAYFLSGNEPASDAETITVKVVFDDDGNVDFDIS